MSKKANFGLDFFCDLLAFLSIWNIYIKLYIYFVLIIPIIVYVILVYSYPILCKKLSVLQFFCGSKSEWWNDSKLFGKSAFRDRWTMKSILKSRNQDDIFLMMNAEFDMSRRDKKTDLSLWRDFWLRKCRWTQFWMQSISTGSGLWICLRFAEIV